MLPHEVRPRLPILVNLLRAPFLRSFVLFCRIHSCCRVVGDPDITEKLSTSGVTNTLQVGKTDAKLIYCEAVVFALSAGLLGCQAGPPSSHWSSVSC